jgi:glycosyltransferase involved in cell wall biosynthesis
MKKTFAIVICTYFRKDGSSFTKVSRAIKSVENQTNKDWKIFLIGDHYENEEEFKKISQLLPEEKITAINLPLAVERESGLFSGNSLWCSAGANASNMGINKSIEEGFTIHCHLDDDDVWETNHLEILQSVYDNMPESVFVYTNALYTDRNGYTTKYPTENVGSELYYNNLMPRPERLIHSTASWKLNSIPFKHRNTIEQGRIFPGDADMWERINSYCKQNNLKTVYVPITTVIKFDEATILK